MNTNPEIRDLHARGNEWMTSKEAAQYLKVSPRTIVEWARAGKILGHVLSGVERHVWRFRPDELDAKLNSPAVLR